MLKLEFRDGKLKGKQVDLVEPGGFVGRDHSGCAVVVPDAGVSGHHAWIETQDGKTWWIQDLNSLNGTEIDGQPVVDKPRYFKSDGEICIADVRIAYKLVEGPHKGDMRGDNGRHLVERPPLIPEECAIPDNEAEDWSPKDSLPDTGGNAPLLDDEDAESLQRLADLLPPIPGDDTSSGDSRSASPPNLAKGPRGDKSNPPGRLQNIERPPRSGDKNPRPRRSRPPTRAIVVANEPSPPSSGSGEQVAALKSELEMTNQAIAGLHEDRRAVQHEVERLKKQLKTSQREATKARNNVELLEKKLSQQQKMLDELRHALAANSSGTSGHAPVAVQALLDDSLEYLKGFSETLDSLAESLARPGLEDARRRLSEASIGLGDVRLLLEDGRQRFK